MATGLPRKKLMTSSKDSDGALREHAAGARYAGFIRGFMKLADGRNE